MRDDSESRISKLSMRKSTISHLKSPDQCPSTRIPRPVSATRPKKKGSIVILNPNSLLGRVKPPSTAKNNSSQVQEVKKEYEKFLKDSKENQSLRTNGYRRRQMARIQSRHENPYSVRNFAAAQNQSRESSNDRSLTRRGPTVVKPFKLSVSKTRDQPVDDEETKVEYFKARKVPTSHRIPFMVLHSTKNLTTPNDV